MLFYNGLLPAYDMLSGSLYRKLNLNSSESLMFGNHSLVQTYIQIFCIVQTHAITLHPCGFSVYMYIAHPVV